MNQQVTSCFSPHRAPVSQIVRSASGVFTFWAGQAHLLTLSLSQSLLFPSLTEAQTYLGVDELTQELTQELATM